MKLETRIVGNVPAGDVIEYAMDNELGLRCRVMSYGATLTSVVTPDRKGIPGEVTLGYPGFAELLASGNPPYFGVTVGRFANRIRDGRFVLDGKEVRLARNDGGINHLHGGVEGFDKKLWSGSPFQEPERAGVSFAYRSPSGEEGYPGTLDVTVTYIVTRENEVRITYEARADSPTVLNLTNHAYWNLSGAPTALEHELELRASRYLEVDAQLMPTGRLSQVSETPFDFRTPRRVGERIDATGGGYDHCYVLDGAAAAGPRPAAVLRDAGSGRAMGVRTTQPGVQLYSGNFLDRAGFRRHQALCLETQNFPDSVNQPQFPSSVLRPGEVYRHSTVHLFTVG